MNPLESLYLVLSKKNEGTIYISVQSKAQADDLGSRNPIRPPNGFSVPKTGGFAVPKTVLNQSLSLKLKSTRSKEHYSLILF